MARMTSEPAFGGDRLSSGHDDGPPFPADEAERDLLHAEQLRGLARNIVPSAAGNAFIALTVTVALWGLVPSAIGLAGWAVLLCGVSAWRWHLLGPYRGEKSDLPGPARIRRLLRLSELGAFGAGALWGSAVLLLAPPGNREVLTFLTMTVVAMAAASTLSLSTRSQVARAYIVPVLLPLVGRLVYEGDRLHLFWALMALMFMLYLLRFGRGLQCTFVSALSGRVRSQRLAADLAEARTSLQATLDNVEQGIMMIDAGGRVRVCNRQASELLGLSPELMSTRPTLREVLRCEEAGGSLAEHTVGRFVDIGGIHQPERYEHQRSNGAVLDVRSIPIPGGGAVRTFSDVTEARRRESALRTAEAEYRGLFENAVVGAYRSSVQGQLLRANAAFARIVGYDTREELVADMDGRSMEIFYADPALRRTFLERLERDGRVVDFVFEARRPRNGDRIWISHNARLVRGPDGAPAFIEGTVMDITERQTAQEALARAAAAEESNRIKSDFLATMSHELRTPLNAIIGFSEMLCGRVYGPLDDRYAEFASDILHSGRQLLATVNDILDLSRIEAGRLELRPEDDVDAADLARGCLAAVASQAGERGVELRLELPALPPLRADRKRLRQILLNLLSNAVKFTPRGGSVTLSAELRPDGPGAPARIALVVADTGVGMAPEQIEIALQPFRQVDGSRARRHEGTGLGLPIARRLAELHGGSLEIHSMPGRGTIATLWLPAPAPHRQSPSAAA